MIINMLLYHHPEDGDLYIPVVICEYCGKEIHSNSGNILFSVQRNGQPENPPVAVHKDCDRAFCETHGGPVYWSYSTEIRTFIKQLGYSARVKKLGSPHS